MDGFGWNSDPAAERRFADYDAANPRVWELYQRFAFELIRRGFQHHSSDAVLHRVRWETDVTGDDGFKCNNNWTPFYARKFERAYPNHVGFFRKRRSKADREEIRPQCS